VYLCVSVRIGVYGSVSVGIGVYGSVSVGISVYPCVSLRIVANKYVSVAYSTVLYPHLIGCMVRERFIGRIGCFCAYECVSVCIRCIGVYPCVSLRIVANRYVSVCIGDYPCVSLCIDAHLYGIVTAYLCVSTLYGCCVSVLRIGAYRPVSVGPMAVVYRHTNGCMDLYWAYRRIGRIGVSVPTKTV
jgi:hypothetical protein